MPALRSLTLGVSQAALDTPEQTSEPSDGQNGREDVQGDYECHERNVSGGSDTIAGRLLPVTAKRFLDLKQVSDELAVTKAQVYTILKNGDLPAIQVGPKKVWRIDRTKLEEYIERQYAATREAVERGDVQDEAPEESDD